ncbi:MAG: hypothetical protein AAGC65_11795 [Mucilaginibacter sp.]|uniref:hypothetical protein n=1 Tax=Mucilaginibacter sp. TaxID=1882438 RepID=UPI0031AA64A6
MKVKLFSLTLLGIIGLWATAGTVAAQTVSDTDNAELSARLVQGLDSLADVVMPTLIPDYPLLKHFDIAGQNADLESEVENGGVKLRTKNYSKTYPADVNSQLKIENTFGRVTINTWNKPEFKVDVQMKIYADDANDAQQFLDVINIADYKTGASVSFKTIIGDDSGKGTELWHGDAKTRVKKIEINYTVYMPVKNALVVNNRYGNTVLPNLDGKLTISNFYGSLKAGKLSNPLNAIKVHYGSADIENLCGSILDVAFGKLDLMECDKLNVSVSYGSSKIGRIHTSANIKARFCGDLQINGLDRRLKSLDVTSAYSSVKLATTDNENANFNITTNNGDFTYRDTKVKMNHKATQNDQGAAKNYTGSLGKANPQKLITINAHFGAVMFTGVKLKDADLKNSDEENLHRYHHINNLSND